MKEWNETMKKSHSSKRKSRAIASVSSARVKCSKIRYFRAKQAINAANKMNEKGGKYAGSRAYYCITCKGYHLTSKPSRFDLEAS